MEVALLVDDMILEYMVLLEDGSIRIHQSPKLTLVWK